jgi:hypothetical protein
LGLGLGLGLGDPWVTQGSPKRGARVDLRKCLCLQQKWKKAGWGRRSGDLVIGKSGDRKSKPQPYANQYQVAEVHANLG